MELREDRFRPCEDFMARRVSSTFEALLTAAWQLADSFRRLHIGGLAYSDISFGNMFFDPETGDVRICDNDNVDVSGAESAGVLGTPRFMAPEIVRGEARPSADTDRYSLAVLLFYLLLGGHPLDGAHEEAIRSLDGVSMRRLYGETPLYIFDPTDRSNQPVPGIHDNPILFRTIYPAPLLDLFQRSFTAGLHAPNKRVMESEWQEALLLARDGLQSCTARSCGKLNFAAAGRTCWRCHRPLPAPLLLEMEESGWQLVLQEGRKLYPHHVDLSRKNELDPVAGLVTAHPQDRTRLGLRNESPAPWVLQRPDGTRDEIPPGRNAPLMAGNRIQFPAGRTGRVR
jgi:DNA-binding helix-hairpin-helix protein with protein kinase domain